VKYYLISGEASGDLHGAHLISALKKLDSKAEFRAWGGDLIEKEGVTLVKHFKDLAFMGFWEVLKNLPKILNNIAFCKKDIMAFQPEVIIYVDYHGFNLRIAQWAKSKGFKNHYYISPQIWAWKENRIKKMKKCIDELYVILPFEKPFFEEKHQFKVHFVGHPLMDYLLNFPQKKSFLKENDLSTTQPIVALLPGSRMQEIQKMLPLFKKVADLFPMYQFVIGAAPSIAEEHYLKYTLNNTLKVVYNHTYDLLQHSSAALVTSGTATLETALFKVPQIVCYRTNPINFWIAKKILNLKYISLVNLILDRPAVLELIQEDCSPNRLATELKNLMESKDKNQSLQKAYSLLNSLLGKGGASAKTASIIYNQIQK